MMIERMRSSWIGFVGIGRWFKKMEIVFLDEVVLVRREE